MTEKAVQIWFQNRRQSYRKHQQRDQNLNNDDDVNNLANNKTKIIGAAASRRSKFIKMKKTIVRAKLDYRCLMMEKLKLFLTKRLII